MRRIPALALSVVLMAAAAHATTYVMISDEDLLRQADAVAVVSVLTVGAAPAESVPSTDHIVLVERLLKGRVAGSTIVVRVPGGIGPDGLGLRLDGVPHLAEGDRAILFLVPRADGTYGVLHLMLGAFREIPLGDRQLAVRDLGEARRVGGQTVEPFRSFDAFADFLAEAARGRAVRADYRIWLSPLEARSLDAARRMRWHPAPLVRWFEFDAVDRYGEVPAVDWYVRRKGSVQGTRDSLRDAMSLWNGDASRVVHYSLAGRTSSSAGFTRFDGINSVLFEDPNDTLPGRFSCEQGGLVSLAGPWFDPATSGEEGGGSDHRAAAHILGAEIVLNDGARCLLDSGDGLRTRLLARELGHTLGLGTSCGDAATGPCLGSTPALMGALLAGSGELALSPAEKAAAAERYGSAEAPAH